MKKTQRIKRSRNSTDFSRLTGLDSLRVGNKEQCTITKHQTIYKIPIHLYAYISYIKHKGKINLSIKAFPTCGISNCVKQEHLKVIYVPKKTDMEYIDNYFLIDGAEQMAHVLNVPLPIFEEYLKNK